MHERLGNSHELKDLFYKSEIRGILLDLDDTILDTHVVFDRWMNAFVNSAVEKNSILNSREVFTKLVQFNNDLFKTHFVRQDKFPLVSIQLDEYFGTGNLFYNHRDFLTHIYNISPKLLPGAGDMLETFQKTGLPMGLVTHAGKEWTNLKLKENNLEKYFTHVEIVDPGRAKSPMDWKNGAKGIKIKPEYILMGGDNLKGDVLSALSIGIKNAFWIKSKWNLYNEGVVPPGIIQVEETSEVLKALKDGLDFKLQNQWQMV